jgi:hypothetical protein
MSRREMLGERQVAAPLTIGVHRALHEALNSAREARHRLEDGDATPDLDDLVELGTLLATLSESVMAVNSELRGGQAAAFAQQRLAVKVQPRLQHLPLPGDLGHVLAGDLRRFPRHALQHPACAP